MQRGGRWTAWLVLAGWIALAIPPTDAAEPRAVRVARLVEKLGSASSAERNEADRELARLGPDSWRQLEWAAASNDPEVSLRAENLLRQLQAVRLWSPSPVEIASRDATARDLIASLERQTGNHLLVSDDGLGERRLDLSVERGSFWEVLDAICRQSENHVRPHYDPRQRGLVLAGGPPGNHPVSYAGPIRAQITSARRVFHEQLDYEDLESEVSHTFQLNLQVMWEDRFRLLAYRPQPQIVKAITDDGQEIPARQAPPEGWNVVGPGSRQLTASLRLEPPTTEARRLKRLELAWELVAVGETRTLETDDLTPGRSHHQDDLELTLVGLDARADGRWTLELRIARDLVVPEPQELLLQENELTVLDGQGRSLRIVARENLVTAGGVRAKLTLAAAEDDAPPARLRIDYPAIRSRRTLPITFRDVPLPVARPK